MHLAGPENNWHYNQDLQTKANDLRKKMTKAEAALWKYSLRGRKMRGFPFRRQRPILSYIADFACLPLLLVIEIDGSSHFSEEAALKDVKRTQALEDVGFHVLRFSNEEVLTNIDYVNSVLEGWILNWELERG